jgi:hypothetical protein
MRSAHFKSTLVPTESPHWQISAGGYAPWLERLPFSLGKNCRMLSKSQEPATHILDYGSLRDAEGVEEIGEGRLVRESRADLFDAPDGAALVGLTFFADECG